MLHAKTVSQSNIQVTGTKLYVRVDVRVAGEPHRLKGKQDSGTTRHVPRAFAAP